MPGGSRVKRRLLRAGGGLGTVTAVTGDGTGPGYGPAPDDDGGERFDRLLADLEAQAWAAAGATDHARAEELTRAHAAELVLADRLAAAAGVTLAVAGLDRLDGQVVDVGVDVLAVASRDGWTWLVPFGALTWVEGLRHAAPARPTDPGRRLGLAAWLRRWSRDRAAVVVVLRDGTRLTGTPDRAYADHLDLAEHDRDEPRRADAVRRILAVPYAGLAAVGRPEP